MPLQETAQPQTLGKVLNLDCNSVFRTFFNRTCVLKWPFIRKEQMFLPWESVSNFLNMLSMLAICLPPPTTAFPKRGGLLQRWGLSVQCRAHRQNQPPECYTQQLCQFSKACISWFRLFTVANFKKGSWLFRKLN